ncbi:MAG: hypothetical protein DSZ03_08015 [Sulfurimonas sp.]|nr:MAG: hypothetical protein DSZ03_08015 [Sulfurimonas sp.]
MHADSNISKETSINYERYHRDITGFLHQYSEAIDQFLSDNNSSYPYRDDSRKTSLDLSPFVVLEDHRSAEYRFKVRIALKLPRTSKKLRLSFEDFSNSDSVDDSGNVADLPVQSNYLLGLEYFSYDKKLINMNITAGLKINNAVLDPYVGMTLRKQLYIMRGHLTLLNRLKYFLNYRVDNRFEINFGYFINETAKFQFLNGYRYRDDAYTSELTHTLRVHQFISERKNIYVDASLYKLKNRTHAFHIAYYKVGFHYHNTFYKTWLYYEAAPSLMFRAENQYKPTARIFLSLGIIFGEYHRRSFNRFYSNY